MNDKMYSKKTLRAAIRDLEKQVMQLQDRITDTEAELVVIKSVNSYLKDSKSETEQAWKKTLDENLEELSRVDANARIVSPKVLYEFAKHIAENPRATVIDDVKVLRTLCDNGDRTCSLREARDFVYFARGRENEIPLF